MSFRHLSIQRKLTLLAGFASGMTVVLAYAMLAVFARGPAGRPGMAIGALAASGLAAFLLSWRLRRAVSGPIARLARTARSIAVEQDYDVRAVKQSEDEIGLLSDAFNALLIRIQERDAASGRMQEEIETYRGRIETLQDELTAVRRREAAFREEKENAEAATRAKSEFLANVSHEIRMPMNAIIGMTMLLLDTAQNSEQHAFTETIRNSGEALITIVNDILDISKIESGKMELERRPFDLRLCIKECLDLFGARAAEKGLELTYRLDDETPETLVGDVTRVRQILVNLISNAIKYTNRGGVVVAVTAIPVEGTERTASQAGLEHPQYEIQFSVRDTGIGIPAGRLDRLFQSFEQGEPSSGRHAGTRLGLVISKRLTEMMGGRIWVRSEPGEGSTFYFTILAEAAGRQSLQAGQLSRDGTDRTQPPRSVARDVIDPAVLAELQTLRNDGDSDLVAKLFRVYLRDTPMKMHTIRTSIIRKDLSALEKSAHSLKGSSANLGLRHMTVLCNELVRQARAGAVKPDALDLAAELEMQFARVRHALEEQRLL